MDNKMDTGIKRNVTFLQQLSMS